MKCLGLTLSVFAMSFAAAAGAQQMNHAADTAPPPAAQTTFAQMKNLAGTWQGPVTFAKERATVEVSMRITSRGNALVHEMKEAGKPVDPTRYDNPVTVFYLNDDRLLLTHYCDAGNRPRMVAGTSPDGKTVDFELLDISGGTERGHMQRAVFTIIDADHHTEEWTYLMPGDKPVVAHADLVRVKSRP